ncbi:MAG: peptidoglycan DD-metalloendopeptidase family protein [Polyangiaceae bacterium]|nr:peptidoglycan DD-metalloendopeptidase family protein [Polyangiaceae bacterium]
MRIRALFLLFLGTAPIAAAAPGLPVEPALPLPGAVDIAQALPPLAELSLGEPEAIDKLVARMEAEQRAVEREQRALKERERQSIGRTVAFGRAYVRAARAGLLPVAGGFEAFVDHVSRIERLRRAAERELTEQQVILHEREVVTARLRDLETRLAVARVNQRAMAHAQTALLAARDRELAFQKAFEGNGPRGAVVYGPGAGPMDPALGVGGFGSTQGRLPFPVAGRTVLQVARRPGIDGPGVDVRAAPESPVRAVFAGRVAFADEYAAYGRTVIIDHGDRYFSVSAALGAIDVEVGDELPAGARIGTVARELDGGSMYFEIRHGAETVDAAVWLGI